jgi:adenine-specific DNA-methyltransferase
MDFFCGSGTTLLAAQELSRNWIGVDKSEQAIKITKKKLNKVEKTFFSDDEYSYLEVKNNCELKILNEKSNQKVRHFA